MYFFWKTVTFPQPGKIINFRKLGIFCKANWKWKIIWNNVRDTIGVRLSCHFVLFSCNNCKLLVFTFITNYIWIYNCHHRWIFAAVLWQSLAIHARCCVFFEKWHHARMVSKNQQSLIFRINKEKLK